MIQYKCSLVNEKSTVLWFGIFLEDWWREIVLPVMRQNCSLLVTQMRRKNSLLESTGLQTGRLLFHVSLKPVPEEPSPSTSIHIPTHVLAGCAANCLHSWQGLFVIEVSLPAGNEQPCLLCLSSELSSDGIGFCHHWLGLIWKQLFALLTSYSLCFFSSKALFVHIVLWGSD